MRLKVRVDRDGGYRWTMVTSGGKGHEEGQAVACGARSYPDTAACDDAARRLLSVDATGFREMTAPPAVRGFLDVPVGRLFSGAR